MIRTLFLSISLLYQFRPTHTANFSNFIFPAGSSAYGEKHRNRGLTRFAKNRELYLQVSRAYRPAFLLRDPWQKGEAWKDLQMVMKELGMKAPKSNT